MYYMTIIFAGVRCPDTLGLVNPCFPHVVHTSRTALAVMQNSAAKRAAVLHDVCLA